MSEPILQHASNLDQKAPHNKQQKWFGGRLSNAQQVQPAAVTSRPISTDWTCHRFSTRIHFIGAQSIKPVDLNACPAGQHLYHIICMAPVAQNQICERREPCSYVQSTSYKLLMPKERRQNVCDYLTLFTH